jgi:O-glycosyl hydrolase
MTKVSNMGIEPDYIAVHMYDTDVNSFKNRVTQYYEAFGKPLWVTEFAMHVSCPVRCHASS